jgi:ribosomal protein L40E
MAGGWKCRKCGAVNGAVQARQIVGPQRAPQDETLAVLEAAYLAGVVAEQKKMRPKCLRCGARRSLLSRTFSG